MQFGAITVNAKTGSASARVTINNHSAKRSNYVVDLSITTADGRSQLDAAMVAAPGVAAGHTATRTAHFTMAQKLPKGAKLAILNVARIAV